MLDIKKQGVYMFKCINTNKVYIGSTTQSFEKRHNQHIYTLKKEKHKNKYLQSAFNKYGEDNFKFEILEIVTNKELIFEREQYWMNYYNCYDKKYGYNINPLATGGSQFAKEVYEKRRISFTRTTKISSYYFRKIRAGYMTIDQVPEKYKKLTISKLNSTAWNKGLDSSVQDYSHLKGVKKTLSHLTDLAHQKLSDNMCGDAPDILIYNYKGEYLMTFNCSKELERWSIHNGHLLPMILKNKKGRNGYSPYRLSSQNICNCAKGLVPHYKGLIFRNSNLNIPVTPLTINDMTFPKLKYELSRLLEESNNENPVNSEKV